MMKHRFLHSCLAMCLIFSALILTVFLDQSLNLNFRHKMNVRTIDSFYAFLTQSKPLPTNIGDDFGFSLIFALGMFFEPIGKGFSSIHAMTYPSFSIFFFWMFHIVATFVGFETIRKKFGTMYAYVVLLIFLFSENIRFISYSCDVYLFPLYAFVFALYLYEAISKDEPIIHWRMLLGAMLIGTCEWFRTQSSLPAIVFFLVMAFKSLGHAKFKSYFLVLCLIVSVGRLPQMKLSNAKHAFWHSIYTGLFQEGGLVKENGQIVPRSFYKDIHSYGVVKDMFLGWNDEESYRFAKRVDPRIELFTNEYESIIKAETIRLFKESPSFFVKLAKKRFFDLLDLYPFKTHNLGSEVLPLFVRALLCLGFVVLALLYARKSLMKDISVLLLIHLLILALPPMLVHSRYIMYSVSFQCMLICMLVYQLKRSISKD